MPLSVAFRWKTPYIQAPQTSWDRNNVGEGITQAATAIRAGLDRKYSRERQEKLDRIAEEDRQRRIDWEDRQRQVYGQAADTIRGLSERRAALVARQQELQRKLESLKAQLGM